MQRSLFLSQKDRSPAVWEKVQTQKCGNMRLSMRLSGYKYFLIETVWWDSTLQTLLSDSDSINAGLKLLQVGKSGNILYVIYRIYNILPIIISIYKFLLVCLSPVFVSHLFCYYFDIARIRAYGHQSIMDTRGGGWKLVISQNRPTGWIGFASKAQPAMKGFFSLITTPGNGVHRPQGSTPSAS